MVAYSFKKQFVERIRSRAKRQTIRNDRKRHARPGETIQLYTGMRTRQCVKIGDATCIGVFPVRIDFEEDRVDILGKRVIEMRGDLEDFAVEDGFDSWEHMVAFWRNEHSISADKQQWLGVIIFWRDFR